MMLSSIFVIKIIWLLILNDVIANSIDFDQMSVYALVIKVYVSYGMLHLMVCFILLIGRMIKSKVHLLIILIPA